MADKRQLDPEIIERGAGVLYRGAERLADEIGDECAASALLVAYCDFVGERWGAATLASRLRMCAFEMGKPTNDRS